MKIVEELFLIHAGEFSQSEEFMEILSELRLGILCVTSSGSDKFIINPTRRGNGVVPIKENCIKRLEGFGWIGEVRMSLAKGMNPGPIDAVKTTSFRNFALEWETGNISSSHRALNKIAVGILQKKIIGGVLVLPVRNLAQFLTDRIGNFEEFAPYFTLYQNLQIEEGIIGIIGIEHDGVSPEVPLIPKGKDGNAKKIID